MDAKQPEETTTAITTRPAILDVGRLDVLDPDRPNEETQKALSQRSLFRENLIRFALKQTSVNQFCSFKGEGDDARETIYPMGAAADAMFHFLGLSWAQVVEIREPDGTPRLDQWNHPILVPGPEKYSAEVYVDDKDNRWWHVKSGLWLKNDLVGRFEGKRAIGVGYSKNELDARTNAFENLKSKACREILGLKGKTRDDYKAMGIDLSSIRTAEFQDRKGSVSDNPDEAVVKWGNAVKANGGKPVKVKDLSDDDLQFYLRAAKKDEADPAKAKFKPEKMVKAIETELERRAKAPTDAVEDAEAMDKLLVQITELYNEQKRDPKKLGPWLDQLKTIAQAENALKTLKDGPKKKAEPGAEG